MPSPLFGRSAELADIRRLLTQEGVRLLTLTGPGGTGKTRLALAHVSDQGAHAARAVHFVDLAVVDDPADVPASIARALRVQESGSEPLAAILRDTLARGVILLVLDNFERVMGAATFVAELLTAAPDLACLVTSREPLHIRAERVLPVGPLPVPTPELSDLAAIASTPSVALFEDRGRARQPEFAVTSENAATIAAICRRLDGLPLAIELAAAQISVLPPHVILARLEAHEPFVLGAAPDLPARHRTLSAAVGWTYDLLDAADQRVFRGCGVFSGTFGVAAVAALVGERPDWPRDILGTLARLADKSLLQVADAGSDEPRFRLLETIRGFALDALAERGELVETRRRQALYFADLAERAEQRLVGPAMAVTLDQLERDYDNFRAALYWSLEDDGELVVGLRLAGALNRFWMLRGHLSEARQWLERALPRSLKAPAEVRAKALNAAGVLAGLQGDNVAAEVFFRESFHLWEAVGNLNRMAAAIGNIGLAAQDRQDTEQAKRCFHEAERLYTAGGDRRGVAVSIGSRAHLARQEGHTQEAVELLQAALAVFREVGDPRGAANSLANLGHALVALGEPGRSADYFREALEIRRSLGNTLGIAECLEGFAATAAAVRQARRAARLLGAAATLREITGAPLPTTDRRQYEAVLRRIHQELSPEALAREQAIGRAYAPEQAIEYALQVGAGRSVARGVLTRREREIAVLVSRGFTNRQIADALMLSRRTVSTHLEHIFAKLGVQARAEVAVWITRHSDGLEEGSARAIDGARAMPRRRRGV
jgi:predicted ATPase/DNA-binding CsgD family transcriptional regulator